MAAEITVIITNMSINQINGVGFQEGGIAAAVRWLGREGDNEHRLTFRMSDAGMAAYGQGEACLYFNTAHPHAIAPQNHIDWHCTKGQGERHALSRAAQAAGKVAIAWPQAHRY